MDAFSGTVQHAPAPADLDRRFRAFVVDRCIAWSLYAAAGALAWFLLIDRDSPAAGAGLVVGVVLVVSFAFAVALGTRGVTPGLALAGLRTLDEQTSRPIGIGRALVRQLTLGIATVPLFGLGTAALAYTVVEDRSGRRRGWHDHLTRSIVTDARQVVAEQAAPEGPRPVVNLTAQRLEPVARPTGDKASLPGHPVTGDPQRPAPPASAPAPPPPPAPPAPARPVAPPPGVPTPGVPVPAQRWRVTVDTGETCLVEGLALLGRNPGGRPGEQVTRLLALTSETMAISKTHAQLHVAADGSLVVTDRGSTNGTVVMRQGVSRDLVAGRPATLLPGDRVVIGDRELTVTRESP